jgi:hypothetical protein
MSSWSASGPCPNCGADADTFGENRPVDTTGLTCYNCGLLVFTTFDYYSLIDLNEVRAEQDSPLPPLTELPKQEFRLHGGETELELRRLHRREIAAICVRLEASRIGEAWDIMKGLTDQESLDQARREMEAKV